MAKILPKGKGLFVWQPENFFTAGEVDDLVDYLSETQTRWASFKVADGIWQCSERRWNFLVELFPKLRKAGISPRVWMYSRGAASDDAARVEGRNIAKLATELNADGIDLDIEGVWGDTSIPNSIKVNRATLMGKSLREFWAGSVSLCSYRYPKYWMQIPWATFDEFVDCYTPQVYWQGQQNSAQQLEWSLEQYREIGLDKPFVPIGAAYSEHGWTASDASIEEFSLAANQLYKDMESPGYGFWSFDSIYGKRDAIYDNCSDMLDRVTDPGDIVPVGESISLSVTAPVLNIRSQPKVSPETLLGKFQEGDVVFVKDIFVVSKSEIWVEHQLGWSALLYGTNTFLG